MGLGLLPVPAFVLTVTRAGGDLLFEGPLRNMAEPVRRPPLFGDAQQPWRRCVCGRPPQAAA